MRTSAAAKTLVSGISPSSCTQGEGQGGGRILCFALTLLFAVQAGAQTVPFYNASATAFEPEISTAFGGALLDATATVSSNRKYVTVGAQPTYLGSPSFQSFTFIAGPGFVGMSALASSGTAQPILPSPAILDRKGMTLLSPLKP